MNVLLDIGIAALVVLFGYSGYKRGLLYMVINIAGTIAAMLASSFLSGFLATVVYNTFVRDNIVNGLSQATAGISTSDPVLAAESVMNVLSNFSLNVFSLIGVDQASLTNSIQDSVIGLPGTIEEIIRPHAIKMVSCIMTLIIYLVLMIIVAFVARKFTKAINRTAIGIPNRILGALVGIAEAILISMLIGLILYFVMMFISPESCRSLRESMNNTIFYRLISAVNLPDMILSWLASV